MTTMQLAGFTVAAVSLIVLWGVMVMVGAWIFEGKNREPGWGALLAVVFGPAGLVIALCFSKRPLARP